MSKDEEHSSLIWPSADSPHNNRSHSSKMTRDAESNKDIESLTSSSQSDKLHAQMQYIPHQFEIIISSTDWDIIKPQSGKFELQNKYTKILREEFAKVNPYCPIVFNTNRVKKGMLKLRAPCCNGKAVCKFEGCAAFHFVINKKRVQVKMSQF